MDKVKHLENMTSNIFIYMSLLFMVNVKLIIFSF